MNKMRTGGRETAAIIPLPIQKEIGERELVISFTNKVCNVTLVDSSNSREIHILCCCSKRS